MRSLLYVFVIIVGVVLFILSIRAYKPGHINVTNPTKGKSADVFEIMACYLYQNICVRIILKYLKGSFMEYLFRAPQVKKDLRAITPEVHPEILESQYYVKKIKKFLVIFFAGDILALFICISGLGKDEVYEGKYIDRNTYGQGAKQIALKVETKDGEYEDELELTVEETKYTEEELEILCEKAITEINSKLWGDTDSAKVTRESLDLPMSLVGYPFELEWESSDYFLMNHQGKIQKNDIEQIGENVTLTCHFSYREWKRDFTMLIRILPKLKTDKQIWEEQIQETISLAEEEQISSGIYALPEKIGEKEVLWTEVKEDYSLVIFALLIIASCSIYILQDRDLHKQIGVRGDLMLTEYPILINRLTLYLGAGMTIKGAWSRIAQNYKNNKDKPYERNYTYEEMLFSCYEMQCGISEVNAYERFGKRCGLQPYTRLVGLLCQSMKKGNTALLSDLQKEAEDAQELRRSMARKKGEEAGTKLLVPMMIMLAIVMVLVMVPAFLSFSM